MSDSTHAAQGRAQACLSATSGYKMEDGSSSWAGYFFLGLSGATFIAAALNSDQGDGHFCTMESEGGSVACMIIGDFGDFGEVVVLNAVANQPQQYNSAGDGDE